MRGLSNHFRDLLLIFFAFGISFSLSTNTYLSHFTKIFKNFKQREQQSVFYKDRRDIICTS